MAGIWKLPTPLRHNIFVREALGRWNFFLRCTARSGKPLNIVTGAGNAFSGTPKQRSNATGSLVIPSGRSRVQEAAQWSGTSVFAAPAGGTYGNLGRNALIGPGMSSTSASIMRNFFFSHREDTYLQFRFEAFSPFHDPMFSSPGATLGSSLGKITSASGGRELQLAAKIVF
jgi:hypothetical protein